MSFLAELWRSIALRRNAGWLALMLASLFLAIYLLFGRSTDVVAVLYTLL